MKNKLITRFGMLIYLSFTVFFLQAQTTANVGELRNGVATLTDVKLATKVLKANLSASALVSDVNIQFDQYEGKYYLTSSVANDPVSSIGIQLHQDGNTLFAMAGPGVEITCNGYNCADCKLQFVYPRARCHCFDTVLKQDYRCDMTQKTTIGL